MSITLRLSSHLFHTCLSCAGLFQMPVMTQEPSQPVTNVVADH
jgi:hypothetical protein